MENMAKFPRSCLVKIQAAYPTLKKAERRAAVYLLENPEAVVSGTIVEAAELAGCSETTWFRFAKRLSYNGFHALKDELTEYMWSIKGQDVSTSTTLYENTSRESPSLDIARRVFNSSIDALRDTFDLIDEKQYDSAVNALLGANKIVLCGVGDAYAVVRSAYQKFFRAGLNVYANSDQDLQLIAVGNLMPHDVVIAISYSGKTRSLIDLVKFAKERGSTVIAITNFPVSPLTKNSDIVLLTAAFTKHTSGEIISKRITQLCLIESLYVNLLLKSDSDIDSKIQSANAAIDINKL